MLYSFRKCVTVPPTELMWNMKTWIARIFRQWWGRRGITTFIQIFYVKFKSVILQKLTFSYSVIAVKLQERLQIYDEIITFFFKCTENAINGGESYYVDNVQFYAYCVAHFHLSSLFLPLSLSQCPQCSRLLPLPPPPHQTSVMMSRPTATVEQVMTTTRQVLTPACRDCTLPYCTLHLLLC